MNKVYMGLDVEDFIFGEGTTYEENIDNVTEEDMNEFGVIECVDDPDVACYRIALENEQNYNAIMMAMMNREYQVLESTGREMVYEAVDIKHYVDLIKKQIQKWWGKIKGVFKKVMDTITSFVGSNKAFCKRFRARAGEMKAPKGSYNFTGYGFEDLEKATPNYSAVATYLSNSFKSGVEGDAASTKDSRLNTVRGKLIGEEPVSAGDFATALTKHFYTNGGHTTTIDLSGLKFSGLLDELENAPTAKKAAKNAHKEIEKTVKQLLSEVNKKRSDAEGKAAEGLRYFGSAVSGSLTIMSTACNAHLRAITSKMIQDRKAANAFVAANNKKGGVSESAVEEIEVVLI